MTTFTKEACQILPCQILQDDYKDYGPQPRSAPPAPPPMRPHIPFDGTTTNRDAFKGWQLPQRFPAIGLEILGDRMHQLVPPDAKLPFTGERCLFCKFFLFRRFLPIAAACVCSVML